MHIRITGIGGMERGGRGREGGGGGGGRRRGGGRSGYGVATISRLLQIIGLYCRISSLL